MPDPGCGLRRLAPRAARHALAAAIAIGELALAGVRSPARAVPTQFLPVGDPIERELRILDLFR